jgi:hypothetical protein
MLMGALGKLVSGGSQAPAASTFNLATPYGRLMAFFAEIDNTSAQRRLTLTIGDAEMTFDIRNKRVLRMVGLRPDSDGRGALAATITRDYNHLDVQLKLLAELLTGFLARSGQFDIVSRPSTATYSAKADGFPVSEWRFACDLYGVVPANVMPEVGRQGIPTKPEESAQDGDNDLLVTARAPAMLTPTAPAPVQTREPEHAFADQIAPAAPQTALEFQPAAALSRGQQAGVAPRENEADTISSIITALESDPPAQPEIVQEPAVTSDAQVEKFYNTVKKYCDLSMLMTGEGEIIDLTETAAGWSELAPEIAADMKAWVEETSATLAGNQLIMMRSPILQNQSVIFMTSGSQTAFAAFSSHVTGRIFQVANEFVIKKRAA